MVWEIQHIDKIMESGQKCLLYKKLWSSALVTQKNVPIYNVITLIIHKRDS